MSYISISMLLLLYSEGTSTLAAFCYFCIHAYMQNCYIKKKKKKKKKHQSLGSRLMIYIIVYADTSTKTSITWLWTCECYQSLQSNFYNIHSTPTQACYPRMESLKNYVFMHQSRPKILKFTWTPVEFYVNL